MDSAKRMTTTRARPSEYMERHATTVARLRAGETASVIAKELGYTSANIYQIRKKFEALELASTSNNPLGSLSTRARNCLRGGKFDTPEAIKAALECGALKNTYNLGNATVDEIQLWLDSLAMTKAGVNNKV